MGLDKLLHDSVVYGRVVSFETDCDLLSVAEQRSGVSGIHDTWNSEFPGQRRHMAGRRSDVGDDRGRKGHYPRELRRIVFCHQYRSFGEIIQVSDPVHDENSSGTGPGLDDVAGDVDLPQACPY